jgi:archaeosine-15-forming tRNA-guanine transglycosylase
LRIDEPILLLPFVLESVHLATVEECEPEIRAAEEAAVVVELELVLALSQLFVSPLFLF